jgi:hypothetical protein
MTTYLICLAAYLTGWTIMNFGLMPLWKWSRGRERFTRELAAEIAREWRRVMEDLP